MAKYDALRDWLISHGGGVVEMTFDQIADLVGGLPSSAYNHQAWWANERDRAHVQAHAWQAARMRVDRVNLGAKTVRFVPE